MIITAENVKNIRNPKSFFEVKGFKCEHTNPSDSNFHVFKITENDFFSVSEVENITDANIKYFLSKGRDFGYSINYHLFIRKNSPFIYWTRYNPTTLKYERYRINLDNPRPETLDKLNRLAPGSAKSFDDLFEVKDITKEFYKNIVDFREKLASSIYGISSKDEQRWYAQVILNRLIFIYFLQKKGFLENNERFLEEKLEEVILSGKNFYKDFLLPLFFVGFATQNKKEKEKYGLENIPYINGGLFLPKKIEKDREITGDNLDKDPLIKIKDNKLWKRLFEILGGYSWVVDERELEDNGISPDILGRIFEKSVNQKEFGAYYTPREITSYICKNTILPYLYEKISKKEFPFNECSEKKKKLIEELISKKPVEFLEALLDIKILDPACGSGAFLWAALEVLEELYEECIEKLKEKEITSSIIKQFLEETKKHKSLSYFIRKTIITRNLYGVDIMPDAIEICNLRMFLSLVAKIETPEELEPLPNIDFNFRVGNSLIGFASFEEIHPLNLRLFYQELKKEIEILSKKKERYKTEKDKEKALKLRDEINSEEQIFAKRLGFAFQDYIIDKNNVSRRCRVKRQEIILEQLKMFHWILAFGDVMAKRGFDIIVENPPWNAVKPIEKEFFSNYESRLTKYSVDKIEARKIIENLIRNSSIREAWESYRRKIEGEADIFKNSGIYRYQSDVINGRRISGDLNYYKIFLERSYQLLSSKGFLGIIIPSGLHTDAGTKGLRRLFFDNGNVFCVYCFENRKGIFEEIHKSFKFDLFIVKKHERTNNFYGAFMLHDVEVLNNMPQKALNLSWNLMKKISPDSLSIVQFKSQKDIDIANKLLVHPLLKENDWLGKVELYREFDMTNDSGYFNTNEKGLRLYEGKMIEQYNPYFDKPRYWIEEAIGREKLYHSNVNRKEFDYKHYRLGFRAVASSTNRRSMIASILPKDIFCGNSIIVLKIYDEQNNRLIEEDKLLYLCAIFNSFVFDYFLRLKITTNLNMFFIYQMPVPIAEKKDFDKIVENVVLLTEDWEDFKELRKRYNVEGQKLDKNQRLKIIAEIEVIVSKLYGLTLEDMKYILDKFHHADPPTERKIRTLERLILSGLY